MLSRVYIFRVFITKHDFAVPLRYKEVIYNKMSENYTNFMESCKDTNVWLYSISLIFLK